ncbi:MAG: S9 family peptidase, partial [Planctomycetota bacterium]|nr:S9 family peptidase [Planctomycetota bacterium]
MKSVSRVRAILLAGVAAAVLAAPAVAQMKSKLIPRDVLWGNPEKASVQLSPDGSKLAWLAPVDGVMNVWVAPVDDIDAAKAVTSDDYRGIRSYFWAYTNQHILYLQDKGGDENFHVYSTNLQSGETIELTPFEGARASVQEVSHEFPNEILVGVNNRNPAFFDIHRVNITNAERSLVLENPGQIEGGQVAGMVTDDDYNVRMAVTMTPDGGLSVFQREGDGWKRFTTIPQEDMLTTTPVGFGPEPHVLYMIDSRGRNTSAFTSVNLKTGAQSVIAADDKADVSDVMIHPVKKTPEAVAFTYERKQWQTLDKAVRDDLKQIRSIADGELEITSRTLDDRDWIVASLQDDGPVRYYHYDRDAKKAKFLFTNRKELESLPLAKMHPEVIKSRDGLNLVSYLTLPVDNDSDGDARPDQPLPTVLLVHGGPWARDNWGFNPLHQLLANRGYAVLSVNYRGSTGFGKDFINASNMEWAGKMHDDLIDAVDWAVNAKIADPNRVAIMGGSYGGYATLVGMTFTPDVFACGVDIVGPSSLITLMESFPAYWGPTIDIWKTRVGDFTTEAGREFLLSRSPISRVDQIKNPLLIAQGANDPR